MMIRAKSVYVASLALAVLMVPSMATAEPVPPSGRGPKPITFLALDDAGFEGIYSSLMSSNPSESVAEFLSTQADTAWPQFDILGLSQLSDMDGRAVLRDAASKARLASPTISFVDESAGRLSGPPASVQQRGNSANARHSWVTRRASTTWPAHLSSVAAWTLGWIFER